MTYVLKNHRKETEKEFESEDDAIDEKNNMISLGMDSQDLEIIENGETPPEEETKDESQSTQSESETDAKEPEIVKGVAGDSSEVKDLPGEVSTESVTIETEEQFVTDIKGVPDTFVVQMGDSVHIKKTGYYYLAAQMGLEVQTEPLNPTWEGDSDTASWRGIVRDGDKEWSNVGTAHLDHEDMQGAGANLDELAATRSACRALSMATGTGVASMEEMIGQE